MKYIITALVETLIAPLEGLVSMSEEEREAIIQVRKPYERGHHESTIRSPKANVGYIMRPLRVTMAETRGI